MSIPLLDFLAKESLSVPQARVLDYIANNDNPSCRHVAEALEIAPAFASKLAGGLVRRSLVNNAQAQEDKRDRELHLTAAGKKLWTRLEKVKNGKA